MKKLCKRIITFSLVLCMALSVFTGVVYAADTDTVVILYAHCTTNMQKDAGDRIDEILFSGKEGC